jgi:hypothetical protein
MRWSILPLLILATACGDVDDHDHGDDNEVITTVELTFTAPGGDPVVTATWADPENDGSPVIDDIVLPGPTDPPAVWALSVRFLNELESPAEDLTSEVADEGEAHQVFFTGSAVEGPAVDGNAGAPLLHAYDDADANGAPIGLDNTVRVQAEGTGELIVTLRHMPEEGGTPVKTSTSAADVAEGGFAAIGGDNDAEVTFPVEVAPAPM